MQIIVFLASLALLSAGATLSFYDQVGAATATYAAGILTMIFAFLSDFKKFKGLGIEAELLDRKIEEADDLISRLRNISIPLAEMLLSSTARMGRIGTIMPRNQKYELLQKIESELKECGVTDDQLESTKTDWHFYNIFDLASPIFDELDKYNSKHKKQIGKELSEFGKTAITPERRPDHDLLCNRNKLIYDENQEIRRIRQIKDQKNLPSLINKFITESSVFTETEKNEINSEIEESMKDVEFYINRKEFRREDHWFNGDIE